MKKTICSLFFALFLVAGLVAQTKPKPKPPAQSEMDKLLEQAMKDEGLTEAEKVEMKKMMKGVMPELSKKPGSDFTGFTDNRKLIPIKDPIRISSISKKINTNAEVTNVVTRLYGKLISKIPASEKEIINRVQSAVSDGASLMAASVTALLQGHNQAAMGLSMKAVMADPKNVNHQNNMAAILSQSGYPEQAIPFLNKLSSQLPENSTILNNLGYAWLNLGQVDSARFYFNGAAVRNPGNPETQLCNGVIAELKGDPKKAADNYVESFEEAPNPFTENLAKNVKAQDRLTNMDFEKLKSRIVIYEYFKKDWIRIPALSDNVSGFENDMRIKNGYAKMLEELRDKIESMAEASSAELDALAKKGENTFAQEMMKESIKGVSMMSMPAVYVQKILVAHLKEWTDKYTKEYMAVNLKISKKREETNISNPNDKCTDYDERHNEFLAYANPLFRKFHEKKNEEFRVWLNAFCTWSWYVTGNPKNVVMTQCISWTYYLAEMYTQSIDDQEAISKTCVDQRSDGVAAIAPPVIPNFSCPVLVNIPIGLDEIQMSAEAINFDDNTWNIKQAEGSRTPNLTLSYGMDKNDISEPGKYGNPYVKTGNGSVTTSGFNGTSNDEEELTPLSKILDELAPITKIEDELTPLSKIPADKIPTPDPKAPGQENKTTTNDATKIAKAALARKILKDMMTTDCPGEKPPKKRKDNFEGSLDELTPLPDLKHVLDDIKPNGLQTVINNGLDTPPKGKNFIKGLFE